MVNVSEYLDIFFLNIFKRCVRMHFTRFLCIFAELYNDKAKIYPHTTILTQQHRKSNENESPSKVSKVHHLKAFTKCT